MNRILDFKAGKLQVYAYDTREEMGIAAARDAEQKIKKIIAERGEVNAIFAAAPSQQDFLKALLSSDVDFSKMNAFHMDEYIGLDKEAPQGFGNFLRDAIFSKKEFKSINYINGQNPDPSKECERYARLLEDNPPDIVFLGIGENGHLAFNDPPVADFNDPLAVKVVELDEVCRQQQVNDGCFAKLDEVPKTAITLTMSQIMKVKCGLVIVPRETKANAVAATIKGEISTSCPASILREHDDATLYLDRSSAQEIL